MLEIDGSEGGGQLVRTALALSTITGEPFRMAGIRASRPTSGLAAQHLATVETLAAIADAEVSGAESGSEAIAFEPEAVNPGSYSADIGTAGSVTLLFDAVLPLASVLDGRLTVTAEGGTDVKWSPTMDWYRKVKLPLLRRHGFAVAVDVDRRGFYPEGGGSATLSIGPSDPRSIDLPRAGDIDGVRVYSTASADLAGRDVAERQADAVGEGSAGLDLDVVERVVRYADSRSTGSALAVRLDSSAAVSGFDALGERGKPAEAVGGDVVRAIEGAVDSPAAVDRFLADQIAVFVALVGGQVSMPAVTDHVQTIVALLDQFDLSVSLDDSGAVPVLSG